MSRAILLSLFAATAVVAGVPVTFSQGSPAKADEVNKNFNYLDSAVGKKASQASLDAVAEALKNKADQSKLDDLTKTVTTKSSQVYVDTALGRRADTSWVKAKIAGSQGGILLIKNSLAELKDSAAKVRGHIGLGKLATKDSLTAADVGALPLANASSLVTSAEGTSNFLPIYSSGNSIKNSKVRYSDAYSILVISDSAWQQSGFSMEHPTNGKTWQVFSNWTTDALSFRFGTKDGWQNATLKLSGSETELGGDLKVAGKVNTTQIAVSVLSSDVADYVFEPDYKLMPLAEVEAFTKTNKHLPEVPSAAEIEKSGLDLAKMNLLLLKKVEELTLHTIELEKRLKAVEAKD